MIGSVDIKANEPVFACNLAAIEPARREGHQENASHLFGAVKATRERPDGYAFEFEPDTETLLRATRFIDLERLCCPFFGFALEVAPGATSFWLSLTGPEGIKPFIEAELGLSGFKE